MKYGTEKYTIKEFRVKDKITVGGTGANEPKPNVCYQCGKDGVVKTDQMPMGQLLVGFCEDHKDSQIAMRSSYGDEEPGIHAVVIDKNGNEIQ